MILKIELKISLQSRAKAHESNVVFPAFSPVFHVHKIMIRTAPNWRKSCWVPDWQLIKLPWPWMITNVLEQWPCHVNDAPRVVWATIGEEIWQRLMLAYIRWYEELTNSSYSMFHSKVTSGSVNNLHGLCIVSRDYLHSIHVKSFKSRTWKSFQKLISSLRFDFLPAGSRATILGISNLPSETIFKCRETFPTNWPLKILRNFLMF